MTENSKMPSKKLLTWLGVLIIAFGISLYFREDTSLDSIKTTETAEKEVLTTINQMLDLGKHHKWKNFEKLWEKKPDRETMKLLASTSRNFRIKPIENAEMNYVDETHQSMRVFVTHDDGNVWSIVLNLSGDKWLINKIKIN